MAKEWQKYRKPKLAVIGSGIAGLSAAWLLKKKYHVTLFDKAPSLGLGSQNITYKNLDGERLIIDLPIRLINEGYYPKLYDLCSKVMVPLRSIAQSPSFSDHTGETYFRVHTKYLFGAGLHYVKPGTKQLIWLCKFGPKVLRFLYLMRSNRDEFQTDHMTVDEFCQRHGFSAGFCDEFLYPFLAAVCTCSYEGVKNYPISIVQEFFLTIASKHPTRRFVGGNENLQTALSEGVQQFQLGTEIIRLSKENDGQQISITQKNGQKDMFEQVIVCTQANQAARILGDEFLLERKILQGIPYERTSMIVHRDRSLMPNRNSWAPVNLISDRQKSQSMASLWINKMELQFDQEPDIFQTWNPLHQPNPKTLLGEGHFERACVTPSSLKSVEELERLQKQDKDRNLWFCGSYAKRGIPLLEGGVASVLEVADRLGNQNKDWIGLGSAS